MADINARTRALAGTAAQWAAADLVLGDGELVLERTASAVKIKAGNGTARFSALPYLTMTPDIPAEYLTQDEGDARFLQLTGIATTGGAGNANKVPRMLASGLLDASMIPLPPAISTSAGPADAGKLVKTAASGKIDPTLITSITGTYRGAVDATGARPAGTFIPGDYFVNTATGVVHASWTGAAGSNIVPSQQLVYNGAQWDIVGLGSAALVRLADGTPAAPSLAFTADPQAGLSRATAGALVFSTAGAQRLRLSESADATLLLGNLTAPTTPAGGRSIFQMNGSNSSLIALGSGGAVRGQLFADATTMFIGSATAIPFVVVTNGIAKGRFTESDDAQFLVGATASAGGSPGRGIVEVNGSGSAALGLDVGGALVGYMTATTTAVNLGSNANVPLVFATLGTERARLDTSGNLQFGGAVPPASLTGSPLQLIRYSTTTYPSLGFANRGVNAQDTTTYNMGAILASGYRDTADPAICAGLFFERRSAVGGLASEGAVVFKFDNVGQPAASGLTEKFRIGLANLVAAPDYGMNFGPNTYWGGTLIMGPNGSTGVGNNGGFVSAQPLIAQIAASDGSLHLNAGSNKPIYLNYHQGTDIVFCDGNKGQTGKIAAFGWAVFGGSITRYGNAWLSVYHDNNTALYCRNTVGGGNTSIIVDRVSNAGAGGFAMGFMCAGNVAGSISNPTNTTTAYNTSSDARMKENVQPVGEVGDIIDGMEVVSFDWKATGDHTRAGFIAQELHKVVPEAVHAGDNGPEVVRAWGHDLSYLIPFLVREAQSLRARVAVLEESQGIDE